MCWDAVHPGTWAEKSVGIEFLAGILQEVIALSVFVPFSIFYMKEGLSWNDLYAALCIAGAVFFIFRG